jgi:pantothenate synthetase
MRSERYRHPAPKFLVSRCYTTITPESAEIGDFDDNGYVFEDRFMTLRELVEELQDCTEVSSMPLTRETSGSAWAMTGYSIEDYETMEERQESVHFRNLDGSSVDADRAWRVFVLANLATP